MINAEYKPDMCARCGAETWCELRSDGAPQCRACKIELFYERVLFAPIGFVLMGWQRQVLRDLYGSVNSEGVRRYQRAYLSMAKKQGKTFLIGGLPIAHLLIEDEPRPEAYGAAAALDQAGYAFKSACYLIRHNALLKERLQVILSTKRIVRRDGNGFYAVISADGDIQDGAEPSLLLIDELHRWKTLKAETLYDVLTKGMISRREPLTVEITTAGEEYGCPLWWNEHQAALAALAGSIESDRFYARVWAADPRRIEAEPDFWKSREARVQANPSHVDLGGFLKDEPIAAELAKALVNPALRPAYMRYHLNQPIRATGEPVVDMAAWQGCGGEEDLRQWPTYDVDLLIRKWGLLDNACWAGVDASWTTDLSALVLVFPPQGERHTWDLLCFAWLPKGRRAEIERRCKVSLDKWCAAGFIAATPGNAVDLRAIKDKLRWARELFDLREVCFDPWNFQLAASELMDEGFECRKVPQNFSQLSASTKKMLELYLDGKLRHGNNPALNWNAGCLALQADKKDNVQPVKPDRARSSRRIDLVQALVIALSGVTAVPAEAAPGDPVIQFL